MTEHVHDWGADVGDGIVALCKDPTCHKSLDWDEIDRRLNATDRLSAEDAREISSEVHSAWWPLEGKSPYEDGLRAYAAELETEGS